MACICLTWHSINRSVHHWNSCRDLCDKLKRRCTSLSQLAVACRGTFGQVHLGRLFSLPVAIKTLDADASDGSTLAGLLLEATILAGLQHPCLVQQYGYNRDSWHRFQLLQQAAHASLHDELRTGRLTLTAQDACQLLLQIAQGLAYLHAHDSLHGNLNLANVMLAAGDSAPLPSFAAHTCWYFLPQLSNAHMQSLHLQRVAPSHRQVSAQCGHGIKPCQHHTVQPWVLPASKCLFMLCCRRRADYQAVRLRPGKCQGSHPGWQASQCCQHCARSSAGDHICCV